MVRYYIFFSLSQILTQSKINPRTWGYFLDTETGQPVIHQKGPLIVSAQSDFTFKPQVVSPDIKQYMQAAERHQVSYNSHKSISQRDKHF